MQMNRSRHARKKRKTGGVRGVRPVDKKAEEELWRKEFVEKMRVLCLEWKRGVMDGECGDEGNDRQEY